MEENKRIVEVNGIKVEVDLRTAKRVDAFKIGDNVKVLVKDYSTFKTYPGVIVAFDEFAKMPTIVVCYLAETYDPEIKFAYINSDNKDNDLVPCYDSELSISKDQVVNRINMQIEKLEAQIRDADLKKRYFLKMFGKYFQQDQSE